MESKNKPISDNRQNIDLTGSINLTPSTEINFYLSKYKDIERFNIRKFVKSDKYTGPTQQGVSFEKEQAKEILKCLLSVFNKKDSIDEENLLSFDVKKGQKIKTNIKFYKGHYYIDIRIFYELDKYTGPSKRGISIPIELLENLIEQLEIMLQEKKPINDENLRLDELDKRQIKDISIKNLPKKYEEYFK